MALNGRSISKYAVAIPGISQTERTGSFATGHYIAGHTKLGKPGKIPIYPVSVSFSAEL